MQVVKTAGWRRLVKRLTLIDLTVKGVRSSVDLALLISYLVIMVIIDLEIISFELEVAIKRVWDA